MGIGGGFSAYLRVILDKLSSTAPTASGQLDAMEGQPERLQRMLGRLQAAVRGAEQRVMRGETAAPWLGELQDLADDIEYLLDEFEYEGLRRRVEGVGSSSANSSGADGPLVTGLTQVRKLLSFLSPPVGLPLEAMSGRISDVGRRFHKIAEDIQALNVLDDMDERVDRMELERKTRETTSFPSVPEMLGRDEVRNEIIGFLLESSPTLSMLAIVGMGGLGKTTLAQFVYNDRKIGDCFNQKIWVHVSYDFNVKRIIRQILEHAADPQDMLHEIDNLNVLQLKLAEKLRDKRFLLVLDDVWQEDGRSKSLADWQQLCAPLNHGGKGSKIILTTRSRMAADVMNPVKRIQLEALKFDECWSLFKKLAFPDGNSRKYPKLQVLGKEIVKKLNGVPLAATTIGSLLHSQLEEQEWRSVLETELWELEQGVEDILPALRVSYEHLPLHLKRCFAYCCVFPKGMEFDELTLVQLWMAMGYFQAQGRKRMEDVGIDYLHHLVSRSLVQLVNGRHVVHGLLHDLGRQVLQGNFCTVETGQVHTVAAEDHCHHLLLLYKKLDSMESENWHNYETLRTLTMSFLCRLKFHVSTGLFVNLVCLRVLDLSFGNIEALPDSVGNLKHLRYLDLRRTPITCLPESLCCLYMLQTLNLQGCYKLGTLPKGISNLTSLRHLVVKHELISEIPGIGKLASLQELEVFSISEGNGIKIEDLKDMNELRGKLCIQNLQRVESEQRATEAFLKKKKYIIQLEMEWNWLESVLEWSWSDGCIVNRNSELAESVLEALVPPSNLKALSIKWYDGVKIPSWMDHPYLSALEYICLQGCPRWNALPPWLGGLTFLETLDISGLPELKELPPLPSTLVKMRLGFLGLNNLAGLEELSQLQVLLVANLPELRALPPLSPTLRVLTMENLEVEALPEFCQYHAGFAADGVGDNNPSLSNLTINGCPKLTSLREGLLHHRLPELSKLIIMDCKELVYWPEGHGFQATLLSLHEVLIIENCPKLVALPEGSVLSPSLVELKVEGCPAIPDEALFHQLHNLKNITAEHGIHVEKEYPNLICCSEKALQYMRAVDWLAIDCIDQSDDKSPSVSIVYDIRRVGKEGLLNPVPYRKVSIKISKEILKFDTNNHNTLSTCPRHHHLCSSLLVLSISGFPFQSYLLPRGGDGEHFFPPLHLVSLEELVISHCGELSRLPVETWLPHLTALKQLSLFHCPELMWPSVQEGIKSLPSLQSLRLIRCPKLSLSDPSPSGSDNKISVEPSCSSIPASLHAPTLPPPPFSTLITDEPNLLANKQFARSCVSSLRDLMIWDSHLVSFTVVEAKLRFLRGLTLVRCMFLKQLPKDFRMMFPSLEVLSINCCPLLQCIPETGLPTSLEVLAIEGCPELEGDDWPKVAHVRLIMIDRKMVQGSYSDFQELVEKGKIVPGLY
uniref:Putative disease resistance protein RGA3 n=1 Tax=Anthurium amnicola TaxID=1678845 RepID=A0A1D1Z2E0_9ARAE